MRRLLSDRLARCNEESGYSIALTALLLVPLMLFAGLAVDLGSWYANGQRIQRAADAAALAGVVWQPDFNRARTVALDVAADNGYDDNDAGVTVLVEDLSRRQLRVTITVDDVGTFFTGVAIDDVLVERQAVAEYQLPVPLGSPWSYFGNQNLNPSDPINPDTWASIQGPYSRYSNGDPFATKCLNQNSDEWDACNAGFDDNASYRDIGYLYAVEVPPSSVGSNLTVEIFDAGYYERNPYPTETGDIQLNTSTPDAATGMVTEYELFESDLTPLILDDNPTLDGWCSTGPGRLALEAGQAEPTYRNQWTTLCQVPITTAGQYLLRVKTSDIAGYTDRGNGWNQYSLRASTTVPAQPRIYALNDMSIFISRAAANAEFPLAEVDDTHTGKTFEVGFFDAGDGQSGDAYLSLEDPNGNRPPCSYRVNGGTPVNLGVCTIQTSNGGSALFNGDWVHVEIDLNGYSCGATCWWSVDYAFGGQPNDRTVWTARIVGDPVHLVE